MHQSLNCLGGRGDSRVRNMGPPRWEISELSSLNRHSHLKTYFMRTGTHHWWAPDANQTVVIFRQQLKTFYSNNFTSVLNVLFLKWMAHKKSWVYNLLLFHIPVDVEVAVWKKLKYLQFPELVVDWVTFHVINVNYETAVWLTAYVAVPLLIY